MAAEYMHIGIPVLNRKPGMVYNEWGKFWVNESVDEYDYKIEYLKFEEGTRFPELLSKQPHVAYKVDDARALPGRGRSRHLRARGPGRERPPRLHREGRRHNRALRGKISPRRAPPSRGRFPFSSVFTNNLPPSGEFVWQGPHCVL